MRKLYKTLALAIAVSIISFTSNAQTPAQNTAPAQAGENASAPNRVLGEVTAIDAAGKQVTLRVAGGKQFVVKFDEKANYRRVPAGETTMDKAVPILFQDIGVGDRVIARGTVDEANRVVAARILIVISKTDIERKLEQVRADWLRRGIIGVVTALDPATKEVTLSTHVGEASQTVIVSVDEKTKVRRYSGDSIKFSDAVVSSFAGLQVGDHLRALGEKSADGKRFVSEEIVSGSFRTVGGTITAVDVATGEIKINDAQTRQPLSIIVNEDSMLRRLPQDVAKMLDSIAAKSASGGESRPATSQQSGGNIQETIEKLPAIKVADLKPGDAILVSSTKGSTPSRVTAIMIAAGVDDFIKRYGQQANRRDLNLGLGLPAGSL